MGNTNTTIKGLAADLAGTTDICSVVTDMSSTWAASYLLPDEEVLYSLQSVVREFSFTTQALIKVSAQSSTTTQHRVERLEYKSCRIKGVGFQSTGVVDRDCELEFTAGGQSFSVAIARGQEAEVKRLYKALLVLGRAQEDNEESWELAKSAMATTAGAMRLSDADGQSLNQQSDETLAWMKTQHAKTHPSSYKEVIVAALEAARVE